MSYIVSSRIAQNWLWDSQIEVKKIMIPEDNNQA